MSIKLLLATLGFGNKQTVGRMKRISPMTQERIRFEDEVREQFQELKKKGLSIPVFTL